MFTISKPLVVFPKDLGIIESFIPVVKWLEAAISMTCVTKIKSEVLKKNKDIKDKTFDILFYELKRLILLTTIVKKLEWHHENIALIWIVMTQSEKNFRTFQSFYSEVILG